MCYLRVFNNYDVMKELLDLILPRDVLACFEVVKVCTTSARIDIYLDEKNIPPAEYSGQGVLSKGFTVPTSIQDFPLRGRFIDRRCDEGAYPFGMGTKVRFGRFNRGYDVE